MAFNVGTFLGDIIRNTPGVIKEEVTPRKVIENYGLVGQGGMQLLSGGNARPINTVGDFLNPFAPSAGTSQFANDSRMFLSDGRTGGFGGSGVARGSNILNIDQLDDMMNNPYIQSYFGQRGMNVTPRNIRNLSPENLSAINSQINQTRGVLSPSNTYQAGRIRDRGIISGNPMDYFRRIF